jgi:hypothetical protein
MIGGRVNRVGFLMSRKRQLLTANDPQYVGEIEQRVRRLREMLALMAPETGSSALGGTIPYYEPAPRRRAPLLLPSPDTAANF